MKETGSLLEKMRNFLPKRKKEKTFSAHEKESSSLVDHIRKFFPSGKRSWFRRDKVVSKQIEKVKCLLPFREKGALSMRSVEVAIVAESDDPDGSGVTDELEAIILKLRKGYERRSLEDEFEIPKATFASLATAIYNLLSHPICVWISDGGRSLYKGDPTALFPQPHGGSGESADIEAVRTTLNTYAAADEPDTQHDLWESVKTLASDVSEDLKQ